MVALTKKYFTLLLLTIFVEWSYAQEFSAGINTEDPNRFAVLHLVAPNGNQGLLLPKLDTSQRTALISSLGNTENGLMVYDQQENQIYFWQGSRWISLIQKMAKDPANGNLITLENGGSVNIGEGTPVTGHILEWDGINWVPSPPPGVQTLTLAGNILDISNGNNVDLSLYLDNTDNQDLTLAGNTLSLTNDGTTIDLSGYLDNTDDQTVDQFDLTGATLNLSLENDGVAPFSVDLSSFSLPPQAGNGGNYLTTDGVVTSWDPLGSLAQLDLVASAEIADGSVGELELANSVAGDGIAGGGGIPLSVDLAPGSGMDFNTNQLQMEELYPGGITYDAGASQAVNTITFDSKGRFVSATAVLVVSDRRLKKEITHLDNSLDKIHHINGYNYYMKSDTSNKDLKTGVIAQEIKEVFPNLILTRPDGYYGVDYQGLIPILLEAIKEQQVIINDVKKELTTQKQLNTIYEAKFNAMEARLDQVLQMLQVVESPEKIN